MATKKFPYMPFKKEYTATLLSKLSGSWPYPPALFLENLAALSTFYMHDGAFAADLQQ